MGTETESRDSSLILIKQGAEAVSYNHFFFLFVQSISTYPLLLLYKSVILILKFVYFVIDEISLMCLVFVVEGF
jgi:hypothetical protein